MPTCKLKDNFPCYLITCLFSLQCTRSCGGGVRERKVACFDTDLNTYPEDQCGATSRPLSVESCNMQPCPRVQSEKNIF